MYSVGTQFPIENISACRRYLADPNGPYSQGAASPVHKAWANSQREDDRTIISVHYSSMQPTFLCQLIVIHWL